LTATPVSQSQLGMDAAFPVNDEHERSLVSIQVRDNFVDQRSHDSLLQSCIRAVAIPHRLSIAAQDLEILSCGSSDRNPLTIVLVDPLFYILHASQRFIPPPLQLIGNQPILRIGQIILFLSTLSRVNGGLPFSLPSLQNLIVLAALLFARHHCCFHCSRLHDAQNLSSHGFVYR
jgi:hypothetical protein